MSQTKIIGKLVLIEDSLSANVKNVLNFLTSDDTKLKFLCTERPIDKWKLIMKRSDCDYFTSTDQLKGELQNSNSCSVIIDSVNQLAVSTSWEDTLKFIEYLYKSNTIKRIFLVLHNDCMVYGEKMLKQLKHISQTHMYLKCMVPPKNLRVEITTISTGGKITKTENEIYFDNNQNKWTIIEVNKAVTKPNDKKEDIINNMTSFKISVEKQAEAVKNDLVLPYTEISKVKNNLVIEPDYDDWDDEDPDDDLSI